MTDNRLTEMIAEQNRWLNDLDHREELIALINTYNESSSPSVPRTDEEHAIERDRARIALRSIKRNFIEGRDYRELSNGALWPIGVK